MARHGTRPAGQPTKLKRAFVKAYIENGGNKTAAYLTASPNSKASAATAIKEAKRLLADPWVAGKLKDLPARLDAELEITFDRIARERAAVAFARANAAADWGMKEVLVSESTGRGKNRRVRKVRRLVPFLHVRNAADLPDHVLASVSEIRMTDAGLVLKFHDKLAALDALAKQFGFEKPEGQKGLGQTLHLEIVLADGTPAAIGNAKAAPMIEAQPVPGSVTVDL